MGQRSRKRGRRSKPAGARVAAPASSPPAAAPSSTPARAASSPAPSRSEQRNAAVRATLRPYAPGERPWSIRVAVLVAILIGAGNVVGLLVGGKVGLGNTHPGKGGVIVFAALMLLCAGGMWRMKYWALLGFQAILAFVILFVALALISATSALVALVEVAVIGAAGFLFYKLVRVLSRVQMPSRPQR